jgi:hypothetical protein
VTEQELAIGIGSFIVGLIVGGSGVYYQGRADRRAAQRYRDYEEGKRRDERASLTQLRTVCDGLLRALASGPIRGRAAAERWRTRADELEVATAHHIPSLAGLGVLAAESMRQAARHRGRHDASVKALRELRDAADRLLPRVARGDVTLPSLEAEGSGETSRERRPGFGGTTNP